MPTLIPLHHVIVHAPTEHTTSGARMITPPDDAFNPHHLRITPVAEVRAGDTIIGTIQPHYDHLLVPLDRAQWVSYFSHTSKPQSTDSRPFDPTHCWLCTHNAYARNLNTTSGHWTVDGCTTYRPDSLLLVIPRELTTPAHYPTPAGGTVHVTDNGPNTHWRYTSHCTGTNCPHKDGYRTADTADRYARAHARKCYAQQDSAPAA